MRSLFQTHAPETAPEVEAVSSVFPKIDGADLAAAFVGERLGGDFYDSVRVSPERVLFGLLDVAGRREKNEAILDAAKQIFRTAGSELFSGSDINESTAMTELCLRLNRGLIEVCCGVHSCPAFIGCYHEKFGTLCYTNAGHTPGLFRTSTGVAELKSTGLPLGLFSHSTCDAPTIGLEKDATLLLVSRGVVESNGHHDGATEEFTLDRVKQLLQAATVGTAQAFCTLILNSVDEFAGDSQPSDDRTALALVRTA